MRRRDRHIGFFCGVLLIGAAATAQAQTAAQPPSTERKGFLIGFSMGAGTAACESCDTKQGVAIGFHIGGLLTERVALLFDFGAVAFEDRGHSYQHGVGGLAAQYFVNRRVWLKGGVGLAQFSIDDSLGPRRLGGFVGAGVDLVQRGRFALDVNGRLAVGRHPGGIVRNTSAQIGFTWY